MSASELDPQSMPTSGHVLSEKYRIERLLGEGGMGAVYAAQHVYTKRTGALKLLHKSFSALPDVVERFVREASAAGVIDNPHIVETIDAGKLDTGEPYIFMELLRGSSVEALLELRGQLRFDEAVEIAAQAADGLAAAHAVGIVHRDIKPANLFLVAGDEPFVKLLDFGISKFAPQYDANLALTIEGRLLGTPLYMPPEQVNGQLDLDQRADVYSLGVVLYEMLAGQPPFNGTTLPQLSVRIHQGKYTPLSQLRPDLPEGFDAILGRALAVDREQRYGSAQAFAALLYTLIPARADSFAPTHGGQSNAPVVSSRRSGRPSGRTPRRDVAVSERVADALPDLPIEFAPTISERSGAGSMSDPTADRISLEEQGTLVPVDDAPEAAAEAVVAPSQGGPRRRLWLIALALVSLIGFGVVLAWPTAEELPAGESKTGASGAASVEAPTFASAAEAEKLADSTTFQPPGVASESASAPLAKPAPKSRPARSANPPALAPSSPRAAPPKDGLSEENPFAE